MADDIKTDQSLPDLKASEVTKAQKEGALDAVRESAAQQFKATDGVAVTDDPKPGITKTNNAMHLEYLLDMDPDALAERLKGEGPDANAVTEGQIASLLEMERSGRNRDDVVQVLCKKLGIDSPYEVTDAGPNYTNVVNRKALTRG